MSNWIWKPDPDFAARTNAARWMARLGFTDVREFREWSAREIEAFWEALVREIGIQWHEPFERVLDDSRGVEWTRWFTGGRLNIAENCVDRHAASGGIALIGESEDGEIRTITFAELRHASSRLAT